MEKFDFSFNEYQRFLERCPFTDEEIEILKLRRKGKSRIEISMALNMSDGYVRWGGRQTNRIHQEKDIKRNLNGLNAVLFLSKMR